MKARAHIHILSYSFSTVPGKMEMIPLGAAPLGSTEERYIFHWATRFGKDSNPGRQERRPKTNYATLNQLCHTASRIWNTLFKDVMQIHKSVSFLVTINRYHGRLGLNPYSYTLLAIILAKTASMKLGVLSSPRQVSQTR